MVETGEKLSLEIGDVAHGGTCVARHDGQVIFVSGALPAERVVAEVSDTAKRYARARTVEVLVPSPDRVEHCWPLSHEQGVGGADLGHVALPAQREWKRSVVAEQLRRLAGVEWNGTAQGAEGDDERGGLGWRTRIDVVSDGEGRAGMRAARSHRIVPLDDMPLACEEIIGAEPFTHRYAPHWRYRFSATADGLVLVPLGPDRDASPRGQAVAGAADGAAPAGPWRISAPDTPIHERVEIGGNSVDYQLAAGGFWQVHRVAPRLLTSRVLAAALAVSGAGGTIWDLYAGAGLFSVPLAAAVGTKGALVSVEADRGASQWVARNLRTLTGEGLPQGWDVRRGDTERVLRSILGAAGGKGRTPRAARPDVIVLDPPRSGAGLTVMELLAASRAARLCYVACDPASLARDIGAALQAGYRLTSLEAFDLFPHTHHVECLAVLDRR